MTSRCVTTLKMWRLKRTLLQRTLPFRGRCGKEVKQQSGPPQGISNALRMRLEYIQASQPAEFATKKTTTRSSESSSAKVRWRSCLVSRGMPADAAYVLRTYHKVQTR